AGHSETFPVLDAPENVLEKDKDHQADDQHQSDHDSRAQRGFGQRAAADLLGHQEEHLAAVQRWNRQEVDHGQVDAQEAKELDQLVHTGASGLVRDSDDPDRASQPPGTQPSQHEIANRAVDAEDVLDRVVPT